MANTLTYTQGGYTVTISTDGANNLTTPTASPQIYLNQSQTDKITITYADGYSFYLTDFDEAWGSFDYQNVAGVPSTASASYENTINAILGFGGAANFDIYDANSGILLANNFSLNNQVNSLSGGADSATFSPGVAFQYDAGGSLVLMATTGSGFGTNPWDIEIDASGDFIQSGSSGWSNTYYQVASYSLSLAPTPSPVVETDVPSTISLGRFTANNEWVGSGDHEYSVLNCTASINFSSQLAGFIGAITRTISVQDLSNLYQTTSNVSQADGEHAFPFAKISEPLLQEVLGAETPLKPLHYLFASDFTGYGSAQASNDPTGVPDVLIVNNAPNKGSLHDLDLSDFNGLAIVGKGINISGLTEANTAIVQGDASYTMSVGDELLVIKGGGATVYGGLGVDTVYFADDSEVRARITETSDNHYMVMTAQGLSVLNDVERLRFNDGVTAFDTGVGEHAGEAYRLYQAIFDRTPDQSGLGYWIEQLDSGSTLNDIAGQFLLSNEFQTTYGNTTDSQFINLLYQNVLDRAADTAGYDYWQGILSSGTARETVLASFSESNENVSNVASFIGNGIQFQQWLG